MSCATSLKTVDLYSLRIKPQALLLIGQELLDILALIALQLDDLAHFQVTDNGAIAGKLLLDHFENLLLVKLLGQALDRRQRLAAIALLDPNVDVVLLRLLDLAGIFIRFRERVEGLEVLDGHTRAGWVRGERGVMVGLCCGGLPGGCGMDGGMLALGFGLGALGWGNGRLE